MAQGHYRLGDWFLAGLDGRPVRCTLYTGEPPVVDGAGYTRGAVAVTSPAWPEIPPGLDPEDFETVFESGWISAGDAPWPTGDVLDRIDEALDGWEAEAGHWRPVDDPEAHAEEWLAAELSVLRARGADW